MEQRLGVAAVGLAVVLALLAVGLAACRPRPDRPPQLEGGAGKAPPVPLVDVSLVAIPATYKGAAPAVVKFAGVIRVSRACEVRYTFGRSDGAVGPEFVAKFRGPGKQAVSTSWSLWKDYSGWMTLRTLSPLAVESNRANFTVNVTGPR